MIRAMLWHGSRRRCRRKINNDLRRQRQRTDPGRSLYR
jgi:hypothetical protein